MPSTEVPINVIGGRTDRATNGRRRPLKVASSRVKKAPLSRPYKIFLCQTESPKWAKWSRPFPPRSNKCLYLRCFLDRTFGGRRRQRHFLDGGAGGRYLRRGGSQHRFRRMGLRVNFRHGSRWWRRRKFRCRRSRHDWQGGCGDWTCNIKGRWRSSICIVRVGWGKMGQWCKMGHLAKSGI